MKKTQFPKMLFVSEQGNSGERYFVANRKGVDAIEDDGPTYVATYQLVSVAKLAKTAEEVR